MDLILGMAAVGIYFGMIAILAHDAYESFMRHRK